MKTQTTPADRFLPLYASVNRAFALVGLALLFGAATPAFAQTGDPASAAEPEAAPEPPPPPVITTALPEDGSVFPVTRVELAYLRDNPAHPPLEGAMNLPITFGETPTGLVIPRPGARTITLPLAAIGMEGPTAFHATGLQYALEQLRDYFVTQDILGVYVAPDPTQISEIGADLRRGEGLLRLIVTTGIVTEMRTIASGERVRENGQIIPEQRIDNTLHTRIIERSPIRPEREGDPLRRDLLRKSDLDNYLFHLARHPGRRVDASVAAAQEVGGIALDYIVTENHPVVFYAQISNTGTRSTDYLRQRFGFFNTQLTFNDDILSLDYTTASFDDVHAFSGSYEAPFPNDRMRWRVAATYSEYNAQEVGTFANNFEGESWSLAGEIVANVYQQREFFVDVVGGLRLENQEVTNNTFAPFLITKGEELFLFPYVGLRLERSTEWVRSNADLTLEFQIGDVTDVEISELNALGRTLPDRDWAVLRWNMGHSVFLEPLFNRAAWEDPTTPETSTLAHEMTFSFRGQYAFDNRLIPQSEHVAGGLYTVRGYPESVVAGDTALIGTIEYRFHLPRSFAIQPEPTQLFGEPFRAAPQYVYGTPDWDLVLKGFFDIGHTIISDNLAFENDSETLYGAGIGFDLLYRRNVNIRVDWGFALDDLAPGNVNKGANRLQAVATFLY